MGEVGGEHDDAVGELRRALGNNFNKLEALQWEAEQGKIGASEAGGKLEMLPPRDELEKQHIVGETPVLDERSVEAIDEVDSSKESTMSLEQIRAIIDEWAEKYAILSPQDKSFFIIHLRQRGDPAVVAEELFAKIEDNPGQISLYELYDTFKRSGARDVTSRLGALLKNRADVIMDPHNMAGRAKIVELLAEQGTVQAVANLKDFAHAVMECNFEDLENASKSPPEMRKDEQEMILKNVGNILEDKIIHSAVDEEALDHAKRELLRLREVIHNNLEECEYQIQQWKKGHPEWRSSK